MTESDSTEQVVPFYPHKLQQGTSSLPPSVDEAGL